MTDLHADLKARWRPSDSQLAAADDALVLAATDGAEGRRAVFTAHVLVDKHYGIWDTGVGLLPLPGVYADRDAASAATQIAAEKIHHATGLPVTGGYTRHVRPGEWAVFEDILAVFPQEER